MTKELLVATTVRIGDILEMGYPGFPVLGTVPVAPLFVTVRAEGGVGDLEHWIRHESGPVEAIAGPS